MEIPSEQSRDEMTSGEQINRETRIEDGQNENEEENPEIMTFVWAHEKSKKIKKIGKNLLEGKLM